VAFSNNKNVKSTKILPLGTGIPSLAITPESNSHAIRRSTPLPSLRPNKRSQKLRKTRN